MPQKISPFLNINYGWSFGENGWNVGMDENLLKLSALVNATFQGVVNTLPTTPTNGLVVFLNTDKKLYYWVNGTWYFTSLPIGFKITNSITKEEYSFDGDTLVKLPSLNEIRIDLDTAEASLSKVSSDVNSVVAQVTNNTDSIDDFKDVTDITKGAYQIGYRNRSVGNRLDDLPNARDYSGTSLSSLIRDKPYISLPDGYQYTTLPPSYDALLDYYGPEVPLLNPYGEDGTSDLMKVKRLMRGQLIANHIGSSRGIFGVEGYARGSGANGPGNADYALMVTLQKKGFSDGTATVGEIDGMQMVIRQGGKDSDVCAGLFNVAHYGTGFNAIFEGQTSRIDPASSTITKQMQTQMGLVGNSDADKNGLAVGFHAVANTGVLDEGIRISDSEGVWNYFFRGIRGGVTTFLVDSYGQMTLADATGNTKTIGVDQNAFRILNHAKDKQLLVLADTGLMTLNGQMSAGQYRVNNIKVVGDRNTGWEPITGVASKATLTTYEPTTAAATYTQTQMQNLMNAVQAMSRRMMAIDGMLRTHGLID